MFLFIGGFQLSFGPMAWSIVAEVFPNELRGKATALCVQTKFGCYGIVQFAVSVFGFHGSFALFAVFPSTVFTSYTLVFPKRAV